MRKLFKERKEINEGKKKRKRKKKKIVLVV
jgi:hypothetical protein